MSILQEKRSISFLIITVAIYAQSAMTVTGLRVIIKKHQGTSPAVSKDRLTLEEPKHASISAANDDKGREMMNQDTQDGQESRRRPPEKKPQAATTSPALSKGHLTVTETKPASPSAASTNNDNRETKKEIPSTRPSEILIGPRPERKKDLDLTSGCKSVKPLYLGIFKCPARGDYFVTMPQGFACSHELSKLIKLQSGERYYVREDMASLGSFLHPRVYEGSFASCRVAGQGRIVQYRATTLECFIIPEEMECPKLECKRLFQTGIYCGGTESLP